MKKGVDLVLNKLLNVLFYGLLLSVMLFLVGCSKTAESQLKNAEILQVTNAGTLQNRGSYTLKEGNLEIMKEIQLAQNLDQDPAELNYQAVKNKKSKVC